MADLPNEDDLKKLPLRAIAAYAARCARRVQPLYVPEDILPEETRRDLMSSVARAIGIAEEFAAGTMPEMGEVFSSVRSSINATRTNSSQSAAKAAAAAAEAVAYSRHVAGAVASTSANPRAIPQAFKAIDDYGAKAAGEAMQASEMARAACKAEDDATQSTPTSEDSAANACTHDVAQLQALNLGSHPHEGKRIDSSANGPLGPLWPEDAAPDWLNAHDSEFSVQSDPDGSQQADDTRIETTESDVLGSPTQPCRLPLRQELVPLSDRAIVAYAVRCAQRALSSYLQIAEQPTEVQDTLRRLEDIIDHADRWLSRDNLTFNVDEFVKDAEDARRSTDFTDTPTQNHAFNVVDGAILTLGSVDAGNRASAARNAANASQQLKIAAKTAGHSERAVVLACNNDYGILKAFGSEFDGRKYDELGPIWPHGEPTDATADVSNGEATEGGHTVGELHALVEIASKLFHDREQELELKVRALADDVSDRIEKIRNLEAEIGKLQEKVASASTEYEAAEKQRLLMWEAETKDRETEFDRQLSGFGEKLREKTKIDAARDYWEEKANEHGNAKKRWAWWAGGPGAVGLAAILCVVLFSSPDPVTGEKLVDYVPLVRYIALVALLVMATTWAVRVPLRIFLTHVHLETDANERKVMIDTYISLVEQEVNAETRTAERERLFEVVFRHSSDGLVKDDAYPLEVLQEVLKTKK